MDYRFTNEEESFRTEVREFLRSELPEVRWAIDNRRLSKLVERPPCERDS